MVRVESETTSMDWKIHSSDLTFTHTISIQRLYHKAKIKNVVLPSATDPKLGEKWIGICFNSFFKKKKSKNLKKRLKKEVKSQFCGNNLVLNPYLIFNYNR